MRILPYDVFSIVVGLVVVGTILLRVHIPKTGMPTTARAVVQLTEGNRTFLAALCNYILDALASFCTNG